jgi:major membrane immunogen (membrane-anchored lipoprotein)
MSILKRKFQLILLGVTLAMVLFSAEVNAQPVLSDIQGNWAEKPIQKLIDLGVINGYPDQTFKPDQPVTRAEFAKIVAKTFKYNEPSNSKQLAPDITGNWAKTYINAVGAQKVMNVFGDGNFKPGENLSRAQLAAMLSRIVRLGTVQEKYSPEWTASFVDVPVNHWAFRYVEIANKLGLLPSEVKTQFQPEQPATRAEAAWMVQALSQIEITKGKITQVDTNSGLVNMQTADGEPKLAMLTPETIIMRNYVSSNIDALVNGDTGTIIALPSGTVKFFKSFGEVTKNDLLSRLSSMTKGKITADQVQALVSGDWNAITNDVKSGVYNKMVDMGLTPAESESIMQQDWNYLDTLSRDRLAQGISKYLGITQEFSQAILSRDVQKIKEYGKIELATAALSRLLGASGQNGSMQENETY